MDTEAGSAEDTGVYCTPCGNNGKVVEANVNCRDCEKFLCVDCLTIHNTIFIKNGHEIWSKDKFGKLGERTNGDDEVEICMEHPKEIVKFYCETCAVVCCGECVVADHIACRLKLIAELPEEIKRGETLLDLEPAVHHLNKNIAQVKASLQNQTKSIGNSYASIAGDIRTFRTDVNEYLDKVEANILESLRKILAEKENDIKIKIDRLRLMETEIQVMAAKLESKSSQPKTTFVTCKQIQYKVLKIQEAIGNLRQVTGGCHLRLELDDEVKAILQADKPFAHITSDAPGPVSVKLDELKLLDTEMRTMATQHETKLHQSNLKKSEKDTQDSKKTVLTYLNEIDVKTENDKTTSQITGLYIMSTRNLAVADYGNKAVKIFNKKQTKIVTNVSLPCSPWDLTEAKPGQLAVTLPESQMIQMLAFRWKSAKAHRLIDVNGKCHGITTAADGIIVTFVEPAKLQLLDLSGNVLRQITPTLSAQSVLERPEYVASSRKDSSIFVSDSKLNTVTKLLLNGSVLSTGASKCLKGVRGLTVTKDGTVFICNYEKNNIMQMNHECKLLNAEDAVDYPWSLCYCADKHRILVNCIDSIKIYQLST